MLSKIAYQTALELSAKSMQSLPFSSPLKLVDDYVKERENVTLETVAHILAISPSLSREELIRHIDAAHNELLNHATHKA